MEMIQRIDEGDGTLSQNLNPSKSFFYLHKTTDGNSGYKETNLTSKVDKFADGTQLNICSLNSANDKQL